MAWKILDRLGARRIATIVVAGLLTTSSGAFAQSGDDDLQTGIVGTWAVKVTLRDCTTNAPLGAPFDAIVTFHRGGTLSESPGASALAIGQRSNAHGAWTHSRGRLYRQRMLALILFDTAANLPGTPGFDPTAPITPGFFAGWQTVTHTVRLTDADHLTSAGTNAFYKANGIGYC
jgi:hypothetical protein